MSSRDHLRDAAGASPRHVVVEGRMVPIVDWARPRHERNDRRNNGSFAEEILQRIRDSPQHAKQRVGRAILNNCPLFPPHHGFRPRAEQLLELCLRQANLFSECPDLASRQEPCCVADGGGCANHHCVHFTRREEKLAADALASLVLSGYGHGSAADADLEGVASAQKRAATFWAVGQWHCEVCDCVVVLPRRDSSAFSA